MLLRKWGGLVEIYVFATIHQVRVRVIFDDGDMTLEPLFGGGPDLPVVTLAYRDNHFEGAIPRAFPPFTLPSK